MQGGPFLTNGPPVFLRLRPILMFHLVWSKTRFGFVDLRVCQKARIGVVQKRVATEGLVRTKDAHDVFDATYGHIACYVAADPSCARSTPHTTRCFTYTVCYPKTPTFEPRPRIFVVMDVSA